MARLDALDDPAARDRVVAAFWGEEARRTPLIEPVEGRDDERIVTFLWRDGTAYQILLFVNRLTDERDLESSLMRRVAGTDVWHLSYRMGSDWRASYAVLPHRPGEPVPWTDEHDQVAVRAALDHGLPDPRNPVCNRNRSGVLQSVAELPDAPPQPWLAPRAGVPRGTVERCSGPDGRTLWVYRPPSAGEPVPDRGGVDDVLARRPPGSSTAGGLVPGRGDDDGPARRPPSDGLTLGRGGDDEFARRPPSDGLTLGRGDDDEILVNPSRDGDECVRRPPAPQLAAEHRLPLLMVLDGEVWTGHQDLPMTLDNLIADREIPPVHAVFVDSGGRDRRWAELDEGGHLDDYLAGDLLAWARERYPISDDSRDVIVVGQSLGALTALWTLVRHPDAVGAAISQSASLWQDAILSAIPGSDLTGTRAWLEVGRQEWVLQPRHPAVVDLLRQAGAEVRYTEFNGGHDYACWRGGLADALRALLRSRPAAIRSTGWR
ncbi:putative esterase [Nostocoides japonicum T1-X7]|uniref:Putative esterase n=1 Tax=Nostocoides japonicum T1-X7 TaxID=1194083 RepID=A0A077LYX8_9MICO|nr:putative esterase [Tetrasphaera japonica T1-X7]